MKELYDVSALILTYNPNLQKLLMTLKSFLLQKGLLLQIVVSDDGSEENYFTEVERMFKKYNFTKYKLVKNEHNV
ncbi:MAG: glycosyltransferase, partial [Odoribacter sp.]|nr:glycosyltransferase [Odoribacter sp.]